jgi:nitrogenase delta subunit
MTSPSLPSVDNLFGYVQKRCLWQFFSRSWDRKENIEGILGLATQLLLGEPLTLTSPMDRLFHADAKSLVADFRERFPAIATLGAEEVKALLQGVKDRLMDLAVTSSKNRELHQNLY